MNQKIACISILLVDDHAVVRQGLRLLLEGQAEFRIVGEAADGEMAIQLAHALKPDVILLDLLMPGVSGIEVIRALHRKYFDGKILVLSSSLEDGLVKQALTAGAHGYILKATRATDLIKAIHEVASGQRSFDPAVMQSLIAQLHEDPLGQLTPREREVFDAMARGLNNAEIAEQLSISEATIRTHIASTLEKLQLRDRTQVMIYALKRGLVRIDELP